MNKILLLIAFATATSISYSQDYVDIVKLSYLNSTMEDVNSNNETEMNNLFFDVNLPFESTESKNLIYLSGFTIENTEIGLASGLPSRYFTMVRAKLGAKIQHNETLSGTYMLLPKMASDFSRFTGDDVQMGALVLFNKQKSEALTLKYGGYFSSEEFGSVFTPLLGLFYRSPDEKLYVNGTFPIRGDINYRAAESFSLGADLRTSIKSYGLHDNILFDNQYIHEESIRAGLYGAVHFMQDKLMLKGKLGLESTDYGLYEDRDNLGLQILTFTLEDDNRNRLNQEFDTALNFGAELVYRFDLRNRE